MTHGAWHETLELVAAVVLTGAGGFFVVASVIARRGRPRAFPPGPEPSPPAAPATLVVILAATLAVAAAVIHLAAAPAHLSDLGPLGWGFVAAAVLQSSWALAYGIKPSRGVAVVGIAGNVAILAAWLWSRTIGLPVGALQGIPEPIGLPDGAATAFEIALVVLLAMRVVAPGARLTRRLGVAPSVAAVVLVPTVGVVMIATALAAVLALGHSHDPGIGIGMPH